MRTQAQLAYKARMSQGYTHLRKRRLAKRFPISLRDLRMIAAASDCPVTKCPVADVSDWRPSWM